MRGNSSEIEAFQLNRGSGKLWHEECGRLTDFEHGILGCRLCEPCERSHSRYALIRTIAHRMLKRPIIGPIGRLSIVCRSGQASREFQLPLRVMQQLPGLDGTTGRVFLREAVQQLAERHHTQVGKSP